MPQMLTENALIFCPHGGKGISTSTTRTVTVNGAFALVEGDTGVLSCPFVLLPCAGYTLRSMGLNATVIGGRKSVLVTDFNQTLTGLPLLMTETHQAMDNSTPAPLPAGATSQALEPAMEDMTPPAVEATTPEILFSISAPVPATAMFTLTAAHPQQWILMLLRTVVPANLDLTNGAAGAVVTPAGGTWDASPLSVSVAMTSGFLAALGVGTHSLYMTGITKRGLNDYAECAIKVSA